MTDRVGVVRLARGSVRADRELTGGKGETDVLSGPSL